MPCSRFRIRAVIGARFTNVDSRRVQPRIKRISRIQFGHSSFCNSPFSKHPRHPPYLSRRLVPPKPRAKAEAHVRRRGRGLKLAPFPTRSLLPLQFSFYVAPPGRSVLRSPSATTIQRFTLQPLASTH